MVLPGLAGPQAGVFRIPDQLPASLGVQMDRRVPAARHGKQVAVYGLRPPRQGLAVRCQGRHPHGPHAPAADHINHHLPLQDGNARLLRRGGDGAGPVGAAIDDRRHFGPGGLEIQGRLIRPVVIGEERAPAPRTHPVTMDALGHRRRQHHAGAVIVRKHQGPLYGPLGEDDAPGADAPQTGPGAGGRLGRGRMLLAPLQHGEEVVIVVAKDRATGQQPRFRTCRQGLQGLLQPDRGGGVVDPRRRPQQAPAELALLIRHNHPGAGASRR